jgi:hypothetical protein
VHGQADMPGTREAGEPEAEQARRGQERRAAATVQKQKQEEGEEGVEEEEITAFVVTR